MDFKKSQSTWGEFGIQEKDDLHADKVKELVRERNYELVKFKDKLQLSHKLWLSSLSMHCFCS